MTHRHLTGILSLSPATSLRELVLAHRDYMIVQTGEYPLWTEVIADIDRLKNEAWEARADEEAAAFNPNYSLGSEQT